MKVEQTRGGCNFVGIIAGLDKKEVRDLGWMKEVSFSLRTRNDNYVPVKCSAFMKKPDYQVTVSYKEKDENGKEKSLTRKVAYKDINKISENERIFGVSLKPVGAESITNLVDIDAIQYIKDNFKNGDMVRIVGTTSPTSYDGGKLEFNITRMFATDNMKEFKDEEFAEVNEVTQDIIYGEFSDNKFTGKCVTYQGEVVDVNLKVNEDFKEDFEGFKFGDLLQLSMESRRIPIYEDTPNDNSKTSNTYVPKGKVTSAYKQENFKSSHKSIVGNEEFIEVVGILNCESKKYTREDIRDTQAEYDKKQEEYKAKKESNTPTESSKIENDDLPY